MGMKSCGGDIVEVQGGSIVRSTGRKDRHSKVYTAKGPRDRRVRLSAHTAIQFYDVQDRLGYDRPSKAVDWLIKKAKSAIDELAELPPWNPSESGKNIAAENIGGSSEVGVAEQSESSGYSFQLQRQLSRKRSNDSSFLQAQLDPHAIIPDNMKTFFPMSSSSSSMNFSSGNHTEDLGLSLHSFQDHQGLIHGQSQDDTNHASATAHQTLFAGSNQAGFEANFQRMMAWNDETSAENRGFSFNPPQLLSQSSAFSQRGPLQSSFSQSIRSWNDLPMASTEHRRAHELHPVFGSRFVHEGLAGFSIPARIRGEEEQSVVSDRPSSSSPNSKQ